MSNQHERFFGRTRKELRRRAGRVASRVRAVESHSDADYKRAVTASLKKEGDQPFAALMDTIATRLPRLVETSMSDYLLDGTYVDRVRLKRILAAMVKEEEVELSTEHAEGLDMGVYHSPLPPNKDDSDIPDRFLEEQDTQEPTDVR